MEQVRSWMLKVGSVVADLSACRGEFIRPMGSRRSPDLRNIASRPLRAGLPLLISIFPYFHIDYLLMIR